MAPPKKLKPVLNEAGDVIRSTRKSRKRTSRWKGHKAAVKKAHIQTLEEQDQDGVRERDSSSEGEDSAEEAGMLPAPDEFVPSSEGDGDGDDEDDDHQVIIKRRLKLP
jgi:hypothetical protein